jgi:hypothetical protein
MSFFYTTESHCALCGVRTESIHIIVVTFVCKGLMECDNWSGAQSYRKYDYFGTYYGSYKACTAFEAVIFGVVTPSRLCGGFESWEEYIASGTRVLQP